MYKLQLYLNGKFTRISLNVLSAKKAKKEAQKNWDMIKESNPKADIAFAGLERIVKIKWSPNVI